MCPQGCHCRRWSGAVIQQSPHQPRLLPATPRAQSMGSLSPQGLTLPPTLIREIIFASSPYSFFLKGLKTINQNQMIYFCFNTFTTDLFYLALTSRSWVATCSALLMRFPLFPPLSFHGNSLLLLSRMDNPDMF